MEKFKSNTLASLIGEWNKRYFTLDNEKLIYYANSSGGFGPGGVIYIRDIDDLSPVLEYPQTDFYVHTNKRSYLFRVESELQRQHWLTAIQKCMDTLEEIKKKRFLFKVVRLTIIELKQIDLKLQIMSNL